MNVTQKLNLFVMKGAEGDQFRHKAAAVAIAIPVIVLVALAMSALAPFLPASSGLWKT